VSDDERLPRESLTPLARRILDVIVRHGYELEAAVETIDAAVPGIGGLFDPRTSRSEIEDAVEAVLAEPTPVRTEPRTPTPEAVVLYVDGSSYGNPGPAGAGAVVQDVDGTTLVRLGRPVGSRTDNNTAEYAALHMGLDHLLRRVDPRTVEVRIDSMTVVHDVWQGKNGPASVAPYRRPICDWLDAIPAHDWRHLADGDPNPADALATVGADIAQLGPSV